MSNLDELNTKLEIVEAASVQESEKPSTSGMSGDRPPRRAGRRPGRRGAKMDERAKLERSRLSARECRARKKLRYQYLEDLVANREKAIFALRDELELYKQWCIQIDEGLIPLALLKMVQEESTRDPNLQKLLSDVVVISDTSDSDGDDDSSEEMEMEESYVEADQEIAETSASYNAEMDSDSENTNNISEISKIRYAFSDNEGTVHTAQSSCYGKMHNEFSDVTVTGKHPIKALSKQISITTETATELTRLHVHEANANTSNIDSTGAAGSSRDFLVAPRDRESVNLATGTSRDFLVPQGESESVNLGAGHSRDFLVPHSEREGVWDLGAIKFGSLDENLKAVEEDEDDYDLDVAENMFQDQRRNRGSGNKSQLPTIVEENEV